MQAVLIRLVAIEALVGDLYLLLDRLAYLQLRLYNTSLASTQTSTDRGHS